MKALNSLLVIILISLCKSPGESDCQKTVPTKANDCYNLNVEANKYKCCYFRKKYTENGKLHNDILCSGVTEEEYNNMANKVKSEMDFIKSKGGIVETFIEDCSSNYLYISLLSLIILLF